MLLFVLGKKVLIGFDFSINKPACTMYFCEEKEFVMLAWPAKLTNKSYAIYNASYSSSLRVHNRNIGSLQTNIENSLHVLLQTQRCKNLCDMIVKDINEALALHSYAKEDEYAIFFSSEGLSFGSVGNSTLDLATYKGAFLVKLLEEYGEKIAGFYTYSPITIKSVAGCSAKKLRSDKNAMINAYMNQENAKSLKFTELLKSGDLSKSSKSSEAKYIECVDDIVDSYWAVMTMIEKENLLASK